MLAMTEQESCALVGRRTGMAQLARQAEGWPAVLALAAGARDLPPSGILPSALHTYLAEELFQGAPTELQESLVRLALLPTLNPDGLAVTSRSTAISYSKKRGNSASWQEKRLQPFIRCFVGFFSKSSPSAPTRERRCTRQLIGAFENSNGEWPCHWFHDLLATTSSNLCLESALNPWSVTGKSRPSRPSQHR